MSEFKSRWDNWEPAKTPTQQTDITAKSPSDSSVSASSSHMQENSASEMMKTSVWRGATTDRSPLATPLGAIAAKSRLAPETLDPGDWRDFYTERAAILERDGHATREQAERLAYEAAVAAIGWILPADFPADRCAACGARLGPQGGLPLSDTALVCDNVCHQQHRAEQRERAVLQLSEWA